MFEEAEHLIDQNRQVAESFIKKHYAEEEQFFPAVWEAFEKWVRQLKVPVERIDLSEVLHTRSGLGFVGEEGLDLVSPIVLSTVAETLQESRKRKLSVSGLELVVRKAATRAGAAGELLACLIHHLPELVAAARSAKASISEAYVSLAQKPQYEIWTEGDHKIIESIGKYEQKKKQYLFWIDLTNKKCESLGETRDCLKPRDLKFLLFLATNSGVSVTYYEVCKEVFSEEPDNEFPWRNRVAQCLTALRSFAGPLFEKDCLVKDRLTDSLSLDESFKARYFIFRTLRSSKR